MLIKMKVDQKPFFKTKDGRETFLYTLENDSGLRAEVSDFGGAIYRLWVPDRKGEVADVTLGCPSPEAYMDNEHSYYYQGVLVGRNSNRIRDAVCKLGGIEYMLDQNLKPHNLHGGPNGLSFRLMEAEAYTKKDGACLRFSHRMEHLSDAFPGNLDIVVTYTITDDNTLLLEYDAVSDAETMINLTHHAYFNLAGHASGNISEQILELKAPFYMPVDDMALCTGEICSVDGTPFDFRGGQSFGEAFAKVHPHLEIQGGFDQNFLLPGEGYRLVGKVSHPASGRTMECCTTLPCVQLYTYNTKAPIPGKDGVTYEKHQGFCLETQTVPNAAAMPWLRSPIYKAGERYKERTGYRFGVE